MVAWLAFNGGRWTSAFVERTSVAGAKIGEERAKGPTVLEIVSRWSAEASAWGTRGVERSALPACPPR